MFVLKTKEEPNPPSNHSFDPPFVHPHFFTGLTWERKVQMFEWMRGEVQGGWRWGTHNSAEGIVKKNNMWDSDKSLPHLSYQIMLKPMSTASKDLVLLKQTDYTMTDKCPSNSRSPNVADNADGADEADDVDGGVREQAERLSQERKQVVALSDGLGSWKTSMGMLLRNMSHLWRGSQKRAFRWLAKLSLVPVDKLTW